ncbi:DNA repair protein-like protein Rhp26/Rad26 [Usnea florida]
MDSSKYLVNDDTTDVQEKASLAEGSHPNSQPSLIRGDTLGEDEASRLKDLATEVRDQDDLERDIGRQADQLLIQQADERDTKRLEKTQGDKEKLENQVLRLHERRARPMGSATATRLDAEISHLEASIKTLASDLEQIQARINERHANEDQNDVHFDEEMGNRRMPNESQRDFLIRTGKITPFSKVPGKKLSRSDSTLQDALLDAEEDEAEIELLNDEPQTVGNLSHRNLIRPGFVDDEEKNSTLEVPDPYRPKKRRRLQSEKLPADGHTESSQHTADASANAKTEASSDDEGDSYMPEPESHDMTALGETESDEESEDATFMDTTPPRRTGGQRKKRASLESEKDDISGLDDGNERLYQNRLHSWVTRRGAARAKSIARALQSSVSEPQIPLDNIPTTGETRNSQDTEGEWHKPHPVTPDTEFEGSYRIPGDIYPSLFDYQKTGVQWLWELYSQRVGGIVGDEMGLGKTIQIIAFLAGLHYSKKITKPIIVVAPATVMKQWVNEFHTWWPPFRVSILHTSGSGMIDLGRESREEDELMSVAPRSIGSKPLTKAQKSAKSIVDRVIKEGHILVTTYSGLQSYAELLIPIDWEYAVLDEGHKIRNPNTAITIYCKELRTANRIILSGTPMQNNLVELWSLFDFVFPMRLGTLVNFRQQFEFPIRQGGYANASNLQVQTAMQCAETLKETISPYLLQRFKADVASDLPKKSEQVLFCKLTKFQRDTYENFLTSDDLKAIMNGKRQILYGVDILRKICNHPDLQDHKTLSIKPGYNYGSGAKSGKMQVVKALLELWKEQGNKTLLFAQHRIMLDILEKFIGSIGGFNYRRMDGTTPIHTRQGLVDEFNNNPTVHVFLLTTKVGGLGINLTGANRVIIYDPDWNPSTDVQARERAWRLGQKREVMIYRLMTAGTIEEKIYHRQLFKQFLINKILKDPKQRQTFQMKDLHDLFTLGGADEPATETSTLFKGTEVRFDNMEQPVQPVLSSDADCAIPAITTQSGDSPSTVRNLTGVASVERFYGEEEEERKAASGAANSEARVMEGIFARAGVQSALEHDQIINGKKVITADPKIIEKEAKRVAAEAAKELIKAGQAAKHVPVGTPTWTGQFGTAGRPEQQQRGLGRGRGGPASSGILAGLQNRQAASGVANGPTGSRSNSNSSGPRGTDFIKMIRDYLVVQGGQVHTQMLIDHFNRYCNTADKTAEFKAMLSEIAKLERGTRGRGRWILKDEYRAKA